MKASELGFNDYFEKIRIQSKLTEFEFGRVINVFKERYIVKNESGEYEAEITGNLRFSARTSEDFPVVGDWVAFKSYDGLAIIHNIMPRFSVIKRKSSGKIDETQIIAANIDYMLIVQAADRDFNLNRLERYLAISYSAHVKPIIVLSKTDLIDVDKRKELVESIKTRISNVPVLAVTNSYLGGYDNLEDIIEKGKTYCMLGSSGAGKSTILNNLSGRNLMKTGTISDSTGKGRHITTHRELIILENGGILIDNPGMREVGIADTSGGLETTFERIIILADECRFKNCKHINQSGCRVIEAVETGEIDEDSYKNFLKLEKEKVRFNTSLAERKKKEKVFGKMLKNYKKEFGKFKQ